MALDEDVADDLEPDRADRLGGPGAAQSGRVGLVDQGALGGQEHVLRQAAFMDHRDQARALAPRAARQDGHRGVPLGRARAARPEGAEVGDRVRDERVERRLAVADVPADGFDLDLDLDLLDRLAAVHGPSVEEVARPLGKAPEGATSPAFAPGGSVRVR
ncbi:hypothetical protein [Streptomyces roseicoloratus]|uniref:hypothetical protein n=1 Tax=Streptomyces roseicoloratus TaxID=2508722 RepID=UPI003CCC7C77